jgi:hypothetical protein
LPIVNFTHRNGFGRLLNQNDLPKRLLNLKGLVNVVTS